MRQHDNAKSVVELTLWIISSTDIICVLSGACELDEDEPGGARWTPHPAKASQLRIASDSQPRCFMRYECENEVSQGWTYSVAEDVHVTLPL